MKVQDNITTPSEAAKKFGCSTETIYNALRRGDLNGFRIGRRHIIVRDKKYRAFKVHDTGIRLRRD
ncbi:MAG: helix-turn-helix domain-containing protein [Rhodothermia bacterium]|nr:helix-turn-helix domain-containing protein [Rhodothermia bacterium]NNE33620.1 helix-turn-helix domain-containing protein [Rhodothermales bacterium]